MGYSDHTAGTFVPAIAVAHGATIIEKHFTMDRLTPVERYNKGLEYMGTDHVLSAEPDELKEMVTTIRRIERICGSEGWDRSNGEKILIDFLIIRRRYGFCMSQNQLNNLPDGKYHLFIDSKLFYGKLTYAEVFIPGDTDNEIFLTLIMILRR